MPKYSIVIPSYGNMDKLERCLLKINESNYRDYEIIVVNDGLKGFPVHKIKSMGNIKLINLTVQKGPGNARNFGANVSCGEIIVFLDSDVYIKQDTIEKINNLFEKNDSLGVVQCVYSEGALNANASSQYKHFIQIIRINSLTDEDYVIGTSCVAIRKRVFSESLGFDTVMNYPGNEDRAFGLILMNNKVRLYFAHEIKVDHDRCLSLIDLLRIDIKRTVSELVFIFSNKNQVQNMLSNRKSYIKSNEVLILLTVFMQILSILLKNGYLLGLSVIMFFIFERKLFTLWFRYDKNIIKQYIVAFLDNLVILLSIILFGPSIWIRINLTIRKKL